MKNQKKIAIEFLILILSILLSALAWKYLKLPYVDPKIVGDYSLNSYNSKNDLLRYIFFVLVPFLSFIFFRSYIHNIQIFSFFSNLKKLDYQDYAKNNFIIIFLLIFVLILFLQFISINFSTSPIDIYHDGQRISSAYKSKIDNSLWSGSYVTVGIFYETISSKWAWDFFDKVSIGSYRFFDLFYILITKILLTLIAYQISNNSKLISIYKIFYFFILFITFNFLIDYNLNSVDLLTFREIPILLFIILFPYTIKNNKISYIILFFISILSVFTLFWGLDRGIIYNLLCLFLLIYFIIINRTLKAFLITIFIIFSWLISWFFLKSEFTIFLSNSISILKEISYIHGIIHPIPFSDEPNASRATKNLILIIISIILSFNLFWINKDKYSYNFKIILLLISLICFLSYFNAVGRSDGPHIKSIFGYPLIFILSYILFNLFYYLSYKFEKFIFKKYYFILIIFLSVILIEINFFNIHNFKNRLFKYINTEDKEFIDKELSNFIEFSKIKLANEQCIQLFSNKASILYLLRKKSCTKYYFVWSVGSEKNQIDFIKDLKNVNIIITDNDYNDLSPNFKLQLVNKFINKNYKLLYSLSDINVLVKRN